MRPFVYRLEQALRWRETQVVIRKSALAAAARQVSSTEALLSSRKSEAATAAEEIVSQPTAAALAAYPAFSAKSRDSIRQLDHQRLNEQRTLAAETERLLEANRNLRLLENLRSKDLYRWQKEFDRELALFADEAFLSGLQSKRQSQKRTGA
jgi:hypothetical protein